MIGPPGTISVAALLALSGGDFVGLAPLVLHNLYFSNVRCSQNLPKKTQNAVTDSSAASDANDTSEPKNETMP